MARGAEGDPRMSATRAPRRNAACSAVNKGAREEQAHQKVIVHEPAKEIAA